MTSNEFSPEEWLRYTRHIQLSDFGAAGQRRLKKAHALVVGMGGLGAPLSLYLAAAGVGRLTIFDGDRVDLSNLQRQVLFTSDDIGQPKVLAAKRRLLALNPEIEITAVNAHFTPAAPVADLASVNLLLDCSDNFPTRYLINDFCLQHALPWLYASVHQYAGQCALFVPGGACFRCLFPEAPENAEDCNAAGVIGVLPGLLGLLQANEALRLLAGQTTELANKLLLFDAAALSLQKIQLCADPNCRCQAPFALRADDPDYRFACASETPAPLEVSASEFDEQRSASNSVLIDVRSADERAAFTIGGRHVPLAELAGQLAGFDPAARFYCYCQSGARSAKAAQLLREQGFKAWSLRGGLAQWLKRR